MKSNQKGNTAPSTTGVSIQRAKELFAESEARMAKPGDPIFDLGWTVGVRRSTPLSKRTQGTKKAKAGPNGTPQPSEPTNLLEQLQADIDADMRASGRTVKDLEPRKPGQITATFSQEELERRGSRFRSLALSQSFSTQMSPTWIRWFSRHRKSLTRFQKSILH